MANNYLPSTIFENKEFKEEQNFLVIGCNDSLVSSLPPGTITIDSSISKVKNAASRHVDKTFLTQDLTTFDLGKTFTNIFSVGTMQCEKNLPEIFIHLEKHLDEEALLYFPLSPAPSITTFLEQDKWIEHTKNSTFQQRSRTEIEEAVLSAAFDSVLIEEKIENIPFYSKDALRAHLNHELTTHITLTGAEKNNCAEELTDYLFKDHNPDQVFTLKSPWILLTLSNDPNIL